MLFIHINDNQERCPKHMASECDSLQITWIVNEMPLAKKMT